jgi:hypothetical protein
MAEFLPIVTLTTTNRRIDHLPTLAPAAEPYPSSIGIGGTAAAGLKAGKVDKVLAAADNAGRAFS